MTNEEKAKEISQLWWRECGWQLQATAYDSAIEAMQWKDEQFEQEKQQWIDKAAVYISTHTLTTMSTVDIHNMIVDFKQAMKGE